MGVTSHRRDFSSDFGSRDFRMLANLAWSTMTCAAPADASSKARARDANTTVAPVNNRRAACQAAPQGTRAATEPSVSPAGELRSPGRAQRAPQIGRRLQICPTSGGTPNRRRLRRFDGLVVQGSRAATKRSAGRPRGRPRQAAPPAPPPNCRTPGRFESAVMQSSGGTERWSEVRLLAMAAVNLRSWPAWPERCAASDRG